MYKDVIGIVRGVLFDIMLNEINYLEKRQYMTKLFSNKGNYTKTN